MKDSKSRDIYGGVMKIQKGDGTWVLVDEKGNETKTEEEEPVNG